MSKGDFFYSQLKPGQHCFIPDPEQISKLAKIVTAPKDNSPTSTVTVVEVNSNVTNPIPTTVLINLIELAGNMNELQNPPSDLIKLECVHRPSILHTLRERFLNDQIYTSIGPILVALNPFKWIDNLYDDFIKEKYIKKVYNLSDNPHVFAIANDSFEDLAMNGLDQSMIISGESGAGKTEATKQCLNFLAYISSTSDTSNDSKIQEKILRASPILEAWGNSKTLRNNNSSRFGKYIEIVFNNRQEIIGALNTTYLLEKNRVIRQEKNERNYHIFYQILKGLNRKDLKKYYLLFNSVDINGNEDDFIKNDNLIEKYNYINQSSCFSIEDVDDKLEMDDVIRSYNELAFTNNEIDILNRIVAAVLNMGNIVFIPDPKFNDEDSECIIEPNSEYHLDSCCKLLEIDKDIFKINLLKKKIASGGRNSNSFILTPYTKSKAIENRDALSKELYQRTFDYIVYLINKKIKDLSIEALKKNNPNISSKSLDIFDFSNNNNKRFGVLDIFGFEIFQNNSFEQLCINLANESLQQHFNFNIFHTEMLIYNSENITVPDLNYNDNQDVLNTLLLKPNGLIPMLDEEGRVPRGSWEGFFNKFSKIHYPSNKRVKVKIKTKELGIVHYAGEVYYDPSLFLVKNKDSLSIDLIETLAISKNKFISELFDDNVIAERENFSNSSSTPAGTKKPDNKLTVGKKFSTQLEALITNLNSTKPRYIRCIKPNQVKKPNIFVHNLTNEQLTYSGIFEAVIIMQNGYPFRQYFESFLNKYHCILLINNIERVDELDRLNDENYDSNKIPLIDEEYNQICSMLNSSNMFKLHRLLYNSSIFDDYLKTLNEDITFYMKTKRSSIDFVKGLINYINTNNLFSSSSSALVKKKPDEFTRNILRLLVILISIKIKNEKILLNCHIGLTRLFYRASENFLLVKYSNYITIRSIIKLQSFFRMKINRNIIKNIFSIEKNVINCIQNRIIEPLEKFSSQLLNLKSRFLLINKHLNSNFTIKIVDISNEFTIALNKEIKYVRELNEIWQDSIDESEEDDERYILNNEAKYNKMNKIIGDIKSIKFNTEYKGIHIKLNYYDNKVLVNFININNTLGIKLKFLKNFNYGIKTKNELLLENLFNELSILKKEDKVEQDFCNKYIEKSKKIIENAKRLYDNLINSIRKKIINGQFIGKYQNEIFTFDEINPNIKKIIINTAKNNSNNELKEANNEEFTIKVEPNLLLNIIEEFERDYYDGVNVNTFKFSSNASDPNIDSNNKEGQVKVKLLLQTCRKVYELRKNCYESKWLDVWNCLSQFWISLINKEQTSNISKDEDDMIDNNEDINNLLLIFEGKALFIPDEISNILLNEIKNILSSCFYYLYVPTSKNLLFNSTINEIPLVDTYSFFNPKNMLENSNSHPLPSYLLKDPTSYIDKNEKLYQLIQEASHHLNYFNSPLKLFINTLEQHQIIRSVFNTKNHSDNFYNLANINYLTYNLLTFFDNILKNSLGYIDPSHKDIENTNKILSVFHTFNELIHTSLLSKWNEPIGSACKDSYSWLCNNNYIPQDFIVENYGENSNDSKELEDNDKIAKINSLKVFKKLINKLLKFYTSETCYNDLFFFHNLLLFFSGLFKLRNAFYSNNWNEAELLFNIINEEDNDENISKKNELILLHRDHLPSNLNDLSNKKLNGSWSYLKKNIFHSLETLIFKADLLQEIPSENIEYISQKVEYKNDIIKSFDGWKEFINQIDLEFSIYSKEILNLRAISSIITKFFEDSVPSNINIKLVDQLDIKMEKFLDFLDSQLPDVIVNKKDIEFLISSIETVAKMRTLLYKKEWTLLSEVVLPLVIQNPESDSQQLIGSYNIHPVCIVETHSIYSRYMDYYFQKTLLKSLSNPVVPAAPSFDCELLDLLKKSERLTYLTNITRLLFIISKAFLAFRFALRDNKWEPEEILPFQFFSSVSNTNVGKEIESHVNTKDLKFVDVLINQISTLDSFLLSTQTLDAIEDKLNKLQFNSLSIIEMFYWIKVRGSEIIAPLTEYHNKKHDEPQEEFEDINYDDEVFEMKVDDKDPNLSFLSSFPTICHKELKQLYVKITNRKFLVLLLLSVNGGKCTGNIDKLNYKLIKLDTIKHVIKMTSEYLHCLSKNTKHIFETSIKLLNIREIVYNIHNSYQHYLVNNAKSEDQEEYYSPDVNDSQEHKKLELDENIINFNIQNPDNLHEYLSISDLQEIISNLPNGFPSQEFILILNKIIDTNSFSELYNAINYGNPKFENGKFNVSRVQYTHLVERIENVKKIDTKLRSDRLDRFIFYVNLLINLRTSLMEQQWDLSEKGEKISDSNTRLLSTINSYSSTSDTTNNNNLTVKKCLNEYYLAQKFFRIKVKGVPTTNLVYEFELTNREWERRLTLLRFTTAFKKGTIKGLPYSLEFCHVQYNHLVDEIKRVKEMEASSGEVDKDVQIFVNAANEVILIRKEAEKIYKKTEAGIFLNKNYNKNIKSIENKSQDQIEKWKFSYSSNDLSTILSDLSFLPQVMESALQHTELIKLKQFNLYEDEYREMERLLENLKYCYLLPIHLIEIELLLMDLSEKLYVRDVLDEFTKIHMVLNGSRDQQRNALSQLKNGIKKYNDRNKKYNEIFANISQKTGKNSLKNIKKSQVYEFINNSTVILIHFYQAKINNNYEDFDRNWKSEINFSKTPRIQSLIQNLDTKTYSIQQLLRISSQFRIHNSIESYLREVEWELEDRISENELKLAITDENYKAYGGLGYVSLPEYSLSFSEKVLTRIDKIGIKNESVKALKVLFDTLYMLRLRIKNKKYSDGLAIIGKYLRLSKKNFNLVFISNVIYDPVFNFVPDYGKNEFLLLSKEICDKIWQDLARQALLEGRIDGARGALRSDLISYSKLDEVLEILPNLLNHSQETEKFASICHYTKLLRKSIIPPEIKQSFKLDEHKLNLEDSKFSSINFHGFDIDSLVENCLVSSTNNIDRITYSNWHWNEEDALANGANIQNLISKITDILDTDPDSINFHYHRNLNNHTNSNSSYSLLNSYNSSYNIIAEENTEETKSNELTVVNSLRYECDLLLSHSKFIYTRSILENSLNSQFVKFNNQGLMLCQDPKELEKIIEKCYEENFNINLTQEKWCVFLLNLVKSLIHLFKLINQINSKPFPILLPGTKEFKLISFYIRDYLHIYEGFLNIFKKPGNKKREFPSYLLEESHRALRNALQDHSNVTLLCRIFKADEFYVYKDERNDEFIQDVYHINELTAFGIKQPPIITCNLNNNNSKDPRSPVRKNSLFGKSQKSFGSVINQSFQVKVYSNEEIKEIFINYSETLIKMSENLPFLTDKSILLKIFVIKLINFRNHCKKLEWNQAFNLFIILNDKNNIDLLSEFSLVCYDFDRFQQFFSYLILKRKFEFLTLNSSLPSQLYWNNNINSFNFINFSNDNIKNLLDYYRNISDIKDNSNNINKENILFFDPKNSKIFKGLSKICSKYSKFIDAILSGIWILDTDYDLMIEIEEKSNTDPINIDYYTTESNDKYYFKNFLLINSDKSYKNYSSIVLPWLQINKKSTSLSKNDINNLTSLHLYALSTTSIMSIYSQTNDTNSSSNPTTKKELFSVYSVYIELKNILSKYSHYDNYFFNYLRSEIIKIEYLLVSIQINHIFNNEYKNLQILGSPGQLYCNNFYFSISDALELIDNFHLNNSLIKNEDSKSDTYQLKLESNYNLFQSWQSSKILLGLLNSFKKGDIILFSKWMKLILGLASCLKENPNILIKNSSFNLLQNNFLDIHHQLFSSILSSSSSNGANSGIPKITEKISEQYLENIFTLDETEYSSLFTSPHYYSSPIPFQYNSIPLSNYIITSDSNLELKQNRFINEISTNEEEIKELSLNSRKFLLSTELNNLFSTLLFNSSDSQYFPLPLRQELLNFIPLLRATWILERENYRLEKSLLYYSTKQNQDLLITENNDRYLLLTILRVLIKESGGIQESNSNLKYIDEYLLKYSNNTKCLSNFLSKYVNTSENINSEFQDSDELIQNYLSKYKDLGDFLSPLLICDDETVFTTPINNFYVGNDIINNPLPFYDEKSIEFETKYDVFSSNYMNSIGISSHQMNSYVNLKPSNISSTSSSTSSYFHLLFITTCGLLHLRVGQYLNDLCLIAKGIEMLTDAFEEEKKIIEKEEEFNRENSYEVNDENKANNLFFKYFGGKMKHFASKIKNEYELSIKDLEQRILIQSLTEALESPGVSLSKKQPIRASLSSIANLFPSAESDSEDNYDTKFQSEIEGEYSYPFNQVFSSISIKKLQFSLYLSTILPPTVKNSFDLQTAARIILQLREFVMEKNWKEALSMISYIVVHPPKAPVEKIESSKSFEVEISDREVINDLISSMISAIEIELNDENLEDIEEEKVEDLNIKLTVNDLVEMNDEDKYGIYIIRENVKEIYDIWRISSISNSLLLSEKAYKTGAITGTFKELYLYEDYFEDNEEIVVEDNEANDKVGRYPNRRMIINDKVAEDAFSSFSHILKHWWNTDIIKNYNSCLVLKNLRRLLINRNYIELLNYAIKYNLEIKLNNFLVGNHCKQELNLIENHCSYFISYVLLKKSLYTGMITGKFGNLEFEKQISSSSNNSSPTKSNNSTPLPSARQNLPPVPILPLSPSSPNKNLHSQQPSLSIPPPPIVTSSPKVSPPHSIPTSNISPPPPSVVLPPPPPSSTLPPPPPPINNLPPQPPQPPSGVLPPPPPPSNISPPPPSNISPPPPIDNPVSTPEPICSNIPKYFSSLYDNQMDEINELFYKLFHDNVNLINNSSLNYFKSENNLDYSKILSIFFNSKSVNYLSISLLTFSYAYSYLLNNHDVDIKRLQYSAELIYRIRRAQLNNRWIKNSSSIEGNKSLVIQDTKNLKEIDQADQFLPHIKIDDEDKSEKFKPLQIIPCFGDEYIEEILDGYKSENDLYHSLYHNINDDTIYQEILLAYQELKYRQLLNKLMIGINSPGFKGQPGDIIEDDVDTNSLEEALFYSELYPNIAESENCWSFVRDARFLLEIRIAKQNKSYKTIYEIATYSEEINKNNKNNSENYKEGKSITFKVSEEIRLLKCDYLFQITLSEFAAEMRKEEVLGSNRTQRRRFQALNASLYPKKKTDDVGGEVDEEPDDTFETKSSLFNNSTSIDYLSRVHKMQKIAEFSQQTLAQCSPSFNLGSSPSLNNPLNANGSTEMERLNEAIQLAVQLRVFVCEDPTKSPQKIIDAVARAKSRDKRRAVTCYCSLLIFELSKMSNVLDFPYLLAKMQQEITDGQKYLEKPIGSIDTRLISIEGLQAAYQAALPSLEIMGSDENHSFMKLAKAIIELRKCIKQEDLTGAMRVVINNEQYLKDPLVSEEVNRLRIEMENQDAEKLISYGLTTGRYLDVVAIAKMKTTFEIQCEIDDILYNEDFDKKSEDDPEKNSSLFIRRNSSYYNNLINNNENKRRWSIFSMNNTTTESNRSSFATPKRRVSQGILDVMNMFEKAYHRPLEDAIENGQGNSNSDFLTMSNIHEELSKRLEDSNFKATQRLSQSTEMLVNTRSSFLTTLNDENDTDFSVSSRKSSQQFKRNSSVLSIEDRNNSIVSLKSRQNSIYFAPQFVERVKISIISLRKAIAVTSCVKIKSSTILKYLYAAKIILSLRECLINNMWNKVKIMIKELETDLPPVAQEEINAVREALLLENYFDLISRQICQGSIPLLSLITDNYYLNKRASVSSSSILIHLPESIELITHVTTSEISTSHLNLLISTLNEATINDSSLIIGKELVLHVIKIRDCFKLWYDNDYIMYQSKKVQFNPNNDEELEKNAEDTCAKDFHIKKLNEINLDNLLVAIKSYESFEKKQLIKLFERFELVYNGKSNNTSISNNNNSSDSDDDKPIFVRISNKTIQTNTSFPWLDQFICSVLEFKKEIETIKSCLEFHTLCHSALVSLQILPLPLLLYVRSQYEGYQGNKYSDSNVLERDLRLINEEYTTEISLFPLINCVMKGDVYFVEILEEEIKKINHYLSKDYDVENSKIKKNKKIIFLLKLFNTLNNIYNMRKMLLNNSKLKFYNNFLYISYYENIMDKKENIFKNNQKILALSSNQKNSSEIEFYTIDSSKKWINTSISSLESFQFINNFGVMETELYITLQNEAIDYYNEVVNILDETCPYSYSIFSIGLPRITKKVTMDSNNIDKSRRKSVFVKPIHEIRELQWQYDKLEEILEPSEKFLALGEGLVLGVSELIKEARIILRLRKLLNYGLWDAVLNLLGNDDDDYDDDDDIDDSEEDEEDVSTSDNIENDENKNYVNFSNTTNIIRKLKNKKGFKLISENEDILQLKKSKFSIIKKEFEYIMWTMKYYKVILNTQMFLSSMENFNDLNFVDYNLDLQLKIVAKIIKNYEKCLNFNELHMEYEKNIIFPPSLGENMRLKLQKNYFFFDFLLALKSKKFLPPSVGIRSIESLQVPVECKDPLFLNCFRLESASNSSSTSISSPSKKSIDKVWYNNVIKNKASIYLQTRKDDSNLDEFYQRLNKITNISSDSSLEFDKNNNNNDIYIYSLLCHNNWFLFTKKNQYFFSLLRDYLIEEYLIKKNFEQYLLKSIPVLNNMNGKIVINELYMKQLQFFLLEISRIDELNTLYKSNFVWSKNTLKMIQFSKFLLDLFIVYSTNNIQLLISSLSKYGFEIDLPSVASNFTSIENLSLTKFSRSSTGFVRSYQLRDENEEPSKLMNYVDTFFFTNNHQHNNNALVSSTNGETTISKSLAPSGDLVMYLRMEEVATVYLNYIIIIKLKETLMNLIIEINTFLNKKDSKSENITKFSSFFTKLSLNSNSKLLRQYLIYNKTRPFEALGDYIGILLSISELLLETCSSISSGGSLQILLILENINDLYSVSPINNSSLSLFTDIINIIENIYQRLKNYEDLDN